eukprot:m.148562 g.148562  ORF g.148562 m.148562 type:complete len:243 (-) comp24393_c0_seq4:166-894(-)
MPKTGDEGFALKLKKAIYMHTRKREKNERTHNERSLWTPFYFLFLLTFSFLSSHSHIHKRINSAKMRSPVFTLFLDCVWQLLQQYPCEFEFTEKYLVVIFEHSQRCEYGTFMFNCHSERLARNLASSTPSLWAFLSQPSEAHRFTNPLFAPSLLVLKPSFRPQSLQVWSSLYSRWIVNVEPHKELHNLTMYLFDRSQAFEGEIQRLETELQELQARLKVKKGQEKESKGSEQKLDPLLGLNV